MAHVVVERVGIGSGLYNEVFPNRFSTLLVCCHWVLTGAKYILFLGIFALRVFSFLWRLGIGGLNI